MRQLSAEIRREVRMKTVRLIVSMCLLWLGAATAGTAAESHEADTEFEHIFDGKTLNGWRGDPVYWRVENGALVGEVTPETILEKNSWIITTTLATKRLLTTYRPKGTVCSARATSPG